MAEVKVTKVEKLDMIIAIVNASDSEDKVMLVEQLETIKTQEINKAAKAKERAAAKKAEGDELRAEVQAILTEEFQSAQAITDAIGKEPPMPDRLEAVMRLPDNAIPMENDYNQFKDWLLANL